MGVGRARTALRVGVRRTQDSDRGTTTTADTTCGPPIVSDDVDFTHDF